MYGTSVHSSCRGPRHRAHANECRGFCLLLAELLCPAHEAADEAAGAGHCNPKAHEGYDGIDAGKFVEGAVAAPVFLSTSDGARGKGQIRGIVNVTVGVGAFWMRGIDDARVFVVLASARGPDAGLRHTCRGVAQRKGIRVE